MILRKDIWIIMFAFMTGCMAVPANHIAGKKLANTLFEKYRARAIASEEQHELQSAFLQWQVAQQLRPRDQEATMKVAELKKKFDKKRTNISKRGWPIGKRKKPKRPAGNS
jgi:hypothetical protein